MRTHTKGRSEDIRSKERKENCKRQGRMEVICCWGSGPKRLVKSRIMKEKKNIDQ